MAYLVIAYPAISESDYDWLQEVRRQRDKRNYGVVKPHFTFVFSTEKMDMDALVRHVTTTVSAVHRFSFSLDSTTVVPNGFQNLFHAFLVPSEGYKEITELHDRLYTGPLESELRRDIPYVPHITIGTDENKDELDALVASLTLTDRRVSGTVRAVTVVERDGTNVVDLATIPLGGSSE